MPKNFSWDYLLGKALTLPPRKLSTTKCPSKQLLNSLCRCDVKPNSWALMMIPVVHGLQVWNLKSFDDDVQAKQPSGCYRSPAEWRVSTVCHCYCSLCLRGNLAPPSSRVILPLLLFSRHHLDLDQDPDHHDGPAFCSFLQ